MKALAIFGIMLLAVILDSWGDAVYDIGKEAHNGKKMGWGHTLQAAAIGILFLFLPMINWTHPIADGIALAASYVAFRFVFFDPAYNIHRPGVSIFYANGWKAGMAVGGRIIWTVVALTFSIAVVIIEIL